MNVFLRFCKKAEKSACSNAKLRFNQRANIPKSGPGPDSLPKKCFSRKF